MYNNIVPYIRFSESAGEEVSMLVNELKILPIAEYIQDYGDDLPEEFKSWVMTLVNIVADTFSTATPDIVIDPVNTLRTISREIHLAVLLRERGTFRLYRLTTMKDESGLPLYMNMIDTDTGEPFERQEDFIGWFCEHASVSRGHVFQRLATIERLKTLGFSLEDSFAIILSRPYAIQQTLKDVAKWDRARLVSVEPDAAISMAEKVAPMEVDYISEIAERARTEPESMEELVEASKPLITGLLQEVAHHERAKEALAFVRHDVLKRPEISYRWDVSTDSLMVEYLEIVDEDETDFIAQIVTVPFTPILTNATTLPSEVREDMIKRLPIKNRADLDY